MIHIQMNFHFRIIILILGHIFINNLIVLLNFFYKMVFVIVQKSHRITGIRKCLSPIVGRILCRWRNLAANLFKFEISYTFNLY